MLTLAFASVARREYTSVSRLWLTGWAAIVLHFVAFLFLNAAGYRGILAGSIGTAALADAAVIFTYASVPYRHNQTSRWMVAALLCTTTLYSVVISWDPIPARLLTPAAVLLGALPLCIAVVSLRKFRHSQRWLIVGTWLNLAVFLLAVQHRPKDGPDLAINGLLFTVYFSCALHFWFSYRRATTGSFLTIAGFLIWSSVFVIGPIMDAWFPAVHVEGEVWNLPKYIVAVGMILLLLEDQLEHNRYLALHDELTGLPNRRLFRDRLTQAIERARRTETRVALLVADLDRFKQVNDSLGHHAGDVLLQQVAYTFAGRMRRSDTVARTGGDEFSVIIENPADASSARQVAEALMIQLNEPLDVLSHAVSVGASIGVALFPDDAADVESLRIAADLRMYDEKNGNRTYMPLAAKKLLPELELHVPLTSDFQVISGSSRA
ncbi:MAG TPA: GGDEF domain-containing protein [Terracidiphilus sp.]|nr:GGDEF domain-containing protein [Terracidiphilus sp.]